LCRGLRARLNSGAAVLRRGLSGRYFSAVSLAPKLSASFGEEPDVIGSDSDGCGRRSDNEHRAHLLGLAPKQPDFRGGDLVPAEAAANASGLARKWPVLDRPLAWLVTVAALKREMSRLPLL
jgi:hypothetical protein